MRSLHLRNVRACAVGTAMILAGCSSSTPQAAPTTTSTSASTPTTSSSTPSWQTPSALVVQSKNITSVPSNMQPTLSQATAPNYSFYLSGSSYMQTSCDPYSHVAEASSPTPCVYGDPASSKVMVLFGDSHVGNWMPALNIVAKNMGYKLDAFEFPACSTSPISIAATDERSTACATWHTTLPKAVQALNPSIVIAVSGPSFEAHTASMRADWASHLNSTLTTMTAGNPTAQKIILGTSPLLTQPAPVCLSIHSSSVPSCALNGAIAMEYYNDYLARDVKTAQVTKSRLIPVRQWFCTSTYCGPIIGSTLVYTDEDHTTVAYSSSLAPSLQQALQSS